MLTTKNIAQALVLSFHYVSCGGSTQAIGLGSGYLCLLSILLAPFMLLFVFENTLKTYPMKVEMKIYKYPYSYSNNLNIYD